jgi:hypothetical protein
MKDFAVIESDHLFVYLIPKNRQINLEDQHIQKSQLIIHLEDFPIYSSLSTNKKNSYIPLH